METIKNILLKSIALCMLLSASAAFGQQTLLDRNTSKDTADNKTGPGKKYYSHAWCSFGMVCGPSENSGSNINYGRSTSYAYGGRYKFKLARHWDIGSDFDFSATIFNMDQNYGKSFPDSTLHDAQRMSRYLFSLGIFNRICIGRAGDYIAGFLDIGAYGSLSPGNKVFYRDFLPGGQTIRSRISGMKAIEKFEYGLTARLGYNKWTLFCKYRLSDIFKSNYSYDELPRFIAGVQVGFHR